MDHANGSETPDIRMTAGADVLRCPRWISRMTCTVEGLQSTAE